MITFTLTAAQTAGFTTAVILPLLVGLATTRLTKPGPKAVALAALSLATSLLTEAGTAWETGTTYDLGQGLLTWLPVFTCAVATHYGIWKPPGISHTLQGIGMSNLDTPTGYSGTDASSLETP